MDNNTNLNYGFWVARDKDESLWLFYGEAPQRDEENECWVNRTPGVLNYFMPLPKDYVNNITWEDEPSRFNLVCDSVFNCLTNLSFVSQYTSGDFFDFNAGPAITDTSGCVNLGKTIDSFNRKF